MILHTYSATRCCTPRCKVELGLPEVHRGVVPAVDDIDVSFSRREHVLVVNVEVFCTECRRFRHEYITAEQMLAQLLAFGRRVAVSERLTHGATRTRLER